jgi:hypothetical protein
MTNKVKIPNRRRRATRRKGPISATAILIHRKEEPQIRPRRIKADQSFGFISVHFTAIQPAGKRPQVEVPLHSKIK